MREQLESIVQYRIMNEESKKRIGLIDPVRRIGIRIDAAYERYKERRKQLRAIAFFGGLVLLELSSFAIYKVNDWVNKRREPVQETQKVSEELYSPEDEIKGIELREINLETMTEADVSLAENGWNELAEFLMCADDEILSIVLPYTQILDPGVLILGEEFELKEALQRNDMELTREGVNSYLMVPLSLPFNNQIRVGEERIELPKKTIKFAVFAVRAGAEADSSLIWIDPKEMGFGEECEIYCFDGEDYHKLEEIRGKDERQAEKYYYDVLNYRVFEIQVSRFGEDEFPIVIF